MKKLFTLILSLCFFYTAQANLILTGVVDGPLSGGTKALEIYVINDIADLSVYGIELVSNGGGITGQEYTFPADMVTAGSFIYLTNDSTNFNNYFGFDATYVNGGVTSFNGNDALALYGDGAIIDIFGDPDANGTGTGWDYLDSWAYRNNNTGPDGSTFVEGNWTVQAPNSLDNTTTNSEAAAPFPLGTYVYGAPANPIVSFSGASVTVGEADGTVDVTLTIVAGNANPTSVDVLIDVASTATNSDDYNITSSATVTFPANDNASQMVNITISDDMDIEPSETLILTLSNPTNGATLGANDTYTITINDNDTPIPALVINEINYNVPSTDSLEFIEIYNNDSAPVDLIGFSFANAITFDIEVSTVINPGEYLVFCNDGDAFLNAFGFPAIDWGSGSLNNTSETIELVDASGNLVDEVTYDDGDNFPSNADGDGPSLELCDPNEDNTDGNNWFAATTATGIISGTAEVFATPGAANTASCLSFIPAKISFIDNNPFLSVLTPEDAGTLTFEVVITDGKDTPSDVTVDIIAGTATGGGVDYTFTPVTLTFPAEVAEDTMTFNVTIIDDVELELIESIEFRLSGVDDMTILEDSTMVVEIADNDTPAAELVITEIYYNVPFEDTLEFVEIYNNGGTEINLEGARFLTGIFHQFQAGETIAPGEYMVLCSDSTAFQNAFSIAATEWDNGGLGNSGELIELYDASGNLADMVDYDDGNDWVSEPDGFGPSLELCDPSEDNNDPFYWLASINATGIMIDTLEILATPGMANSVTCLSDADPVVSFTDASSSVAENVGQAFVGIEITNGNANDTEVTLVVEASGTAVDGSDYTISTNTLTFPAGTAADISSLAIDIIDDGDVEPAETIVLTMTANNNAQAGTITTHTITIEESDGVSNEDIFDGIVKVFPNPVSDRLVIQTDVDMDQIRMLNVLGQEVTIQNNVVGQTEINVSEMSKGIYFLEMTSGSKTATRQIIVE